MNRCQKLRLFQKREKGRTVMLCGCRCAMISTNCMASTSHQSLPRTERKALAKSNLPLFLH